MDRPRDRARAPDRSTAAANTAQEGGSRIFVWPCPPTIHDSCLVHRTTIGTMPNPSLSQALAPVICPTTDFPKSCQAQLAKIFRFIRSANQAYGRVIPLRQRGVS